MSYLIGDTHFTRHEQSRYLAPDDAVHFHDSRVAGQKYAVLLPRFKDQILIIDVVGPIRIVSAGTQPASQPLEHGIAGKTVLQNPFVDPIAEIDFI